MEMAANSFAAHMKRLLKVTERNSSAMEEVGRTTKLISTNMLNSSNDFETQMGDAEKLVVDKENESEGEIKFLT